MRSRGISACRSVLALALGVLLVLASPAVGRAAPVVQGPLGSVGALGPVKLVSATGGITSNTPTCSDPVNGAYTVEASGGNFGQSAVIAVCARHNVGSTPAGTSVTVSWPGPPCLPRIRSSPSPPPGSGPRRCFAPPTRARR